MNPQVAEVVRSRTVRSVGVAILLLSIGNSLVLRRTLDGPTEELTIRGDALTYLSMVEGRAEGGFVGARILVPLVARSLPYSAETSLALVSLISLLISYVLILLLCQEVGFSPGASILALFAVFASPWHLYYYQNPYLTDAFALMACCALLYALVKRKYVLFLLAGVAGSLARETVATLVAAWGITRNWTKTAMAVLAVCFTVLLPRWDVIQSGTITTMASRNTLFMLEPQRVATVLGAVCISWGYLWLLAAVGFRWLSPNLRPQLGAAAALIISGALAPFLVTDKPDVGRYFSLLAPVIVLLAAQAFAKIETARLILSLFALVSCLQLFVGVPTVVTPRDSWAFRSVHAADLLPLLMSGPAGVAQVISVVWPRILPLVGGTALVGVLGRVARRTARPVATVV